MTLQAQTASDGREGTFGDDRDAVGEDVGLVHEVRGQQNGPRNLVCGQKLPNVPARSRVHARCGLVQGHHAGAARKRDADGELPLHATAECSGGRVPFVQKAHVAEQAVDLGWRLAPGHALQAAKKPEVLLHGDVLIKGVVLQANAKLPANSKGILAHRDAVHIHVAFGGWVKPCEDRHGGGFARAVVAQKPEDGATVYVQADTL
mmetsp:Transcript_119086/g.336832  ORF Transcript_119086/g.336832 Transcript_119086/m.336832 type:complete len:205 (+) Transcript_119086:3326-3940(+)